MSVKLLQILAFVFFAPSIAYGVGQVGDAVPLETDRKMSVAELELNEGDIELLRQFEDQVDHVASSMDTPRDPKALRDAKSRQAAAALTDDEITDIIKSITFPNEENITEDSEGHPASALSDEVEPRTSGLRKGRGYYIIAYTPMEENTKETAPYARLQILPAERSVEGGDSSSDARMISKKSWNKYINRLMRQIRRGTRKIQRKTRVKKRTKEPTLENFLKGMYKISKEQRLRQQKKKASPWFFW